VITAGNCHPERSEGSAVLFLSNDSVKFPAKADDARISLLRVHHVQQVSRSLHWRNNDLFARVYQHKNDELESFTKKYRVHRLVYFERYRYVKNAIAREKEIKAWRREKRVALITSINPTWEDLAEQWNNKGEQQIPRPLRGLRDDNSEERYFSTNS
jgi:putative endonuclease